MGKENALVIDIIECKLKLKEKRKKKKKKFIHFSIILIRWT